MSFEGFRSFFEMVNETIFTAKQVRLEHMNLSTYLYYIIKLTIWKIVLSVDHIDYIDFQILLQFGCNITFKSTQLKTRGLLKITFQWAQLSTTIVALLFFYTIFPNTMYLDENWCFSNVCHSLQLTLISWLELSKWL